MNREKILYMLEIAKKVIEIIKTLFIITATQ